MRHEIHDESSRGWFGVTLYDNCTVEGHEAMIRDLVSHNNWYAGINMLIDLRQLDVDETSIDDMRAMAQTLRAAGPKLGPCRHAYICAAGAYSKAAMFHILVDEAVGWTSRLFTADQYEAAIAWLEDTEHV